MGKQAPSAPDPWQTASAQGQWNQHTAQTQQAMNMVNQNTPWGSLNYDQTGSTTIIGPDGKPTTVPQYTANTTLTPEQQAIFEQTQAAQGNMAGLANDQSIKMRELLGSNFEYTNRDAENWAYDLASPRILAQQGQNENQLRTTLANKGIREGSDAWNNEMSRLTNANTDQINQLALTGRNQGFNEALAMRNQPINELSALLSGTQISSPQFQNTPQSGVAGVDYTGLVNQKYQADVANHQNMMGGLFGLGSSLIGMFSDRRLKTDIKRIGLTDGGLPVYTYRYGGEGPYHMGVMADEVEQVIPSAVNEHHSGFKMVNYAEVV